MIAIDKKAHIIESRDTLQRIYFSDKRPWVIAFSGGKDSTLILQLVFEFLNSLTPDQYKPIYILISDTQVEPPIIEKYIEKTLNLIEKSIHQKHLPINIVKVRPREEDSFWSKLIGKGYPSPTRWFRWCTSYLKIRPSRQAIQHITRKHGSVILLLGTRKDESSEKKTGWRPENTVLKDLTLTMTFPMPWCPAPFQTGQQTRSGTIFRRPPPPWGEDHEFMLNLYRQASGDECHLILDLISPSCGGSRFGCWTCTVVKKDLPMQGFIKTGEAWMRPLNEFRDWLKEIREDPSMRSRIRRNGSIGPGPFNEKARKAILKRLFETEKKSTSV